MFDIWRHFVFLPSLLFWAVLNLLSMWQIRSTFRHILDSERNLIVERGFRGRRWRTRPHKWFSAPLILQLFIYSKAHNNSWTQVIIYIYSWSHTKSTQQKNQSEVFTNILHRWNVRPLPACVSFLCGCVMLKEPRVPVCAHSPLQRCRWIIILTLEER